MWKNVPPAVPPSCHIVSEHYVVYSATEITFPHVCLSVCVSRCLSVAYLSCEWVEFFLQNHHLTTWYGCHLTQLWKNGTKISNCFSPGGCYVEGGMKKSRFLTNISHYLGKYTRQGLSYNWTCMRSVEWWPWVTHNLDFKVMITNSKNGTRQSYTYNDSRMWSVEWCHYELPSMTSNPDFKGTPLPVVAVVVLLEPVRCSNVSRFCIHFWASPPADVATQNLRDFNSSHFLPCFGCLYTYLSSCMLASVLLILVWKSTNPHHKANKYSKLLLSSDM